MKHRHFVRSLLLLLFCCRLGASYSQNLRVDNPSVGSSFRSELGSTHITQVWTSEKYTYVCFKYTANDPTQDIAIAFSSNTWATPDHHSSLPIVTWGLYHDGTFSALELDEHYSLGGLREVPFCLVFPRISTSTRLLTVEERAEGGFWWRDISLSGKARNNTRPPQQGNSLRNDSNRTPSTHSKYDDLEGNNADNSPNDISHDRPLARPQYERPFEVHASGSGFAVGTGGTIATCYHVVESAQRIRVRGVNGDFNHPLNAELVASDRQNDLAILRITDPLFHRFDTLPYGVEPQSIDVGEPIFVLGYPLRAVMGDEIKLTNGLVSAWSGFQGDTTEYQITAVVQSGNSGGPVFNQSGNVIGVVNARLNMIEGAAYAVKSRYLKNLLNSIGENPLPVSTQTIGAMPLSNMVKQVKSYVYIIEVEH